MSFKSAMFAIGNGILEAGAIAHNAQIQSQIDEIDEEMAALRAQLTRLEQDRTELEQSKY
jgi:septal ring factor EnvC (AmiA/AmiB activator)